MNQSYKERLHKINTFVFDVDGVFTDGTVLVTSDGELLRRMGVKDGYALKVAIDLGYRVCIITGGTNQGVKERLGGLGVTDFYMGTHKKDLAIREYLDNNGLNPEEVLYMGDDLPDVPAMQLVGIASCPQDAVPEVKAVSHYISHLHGGKGCVRDVIEQVLKIRGDWKGSSHTSDF